MYRAALIFATSLVLGSSIFSGTSFAADENTYPGAETSVSTANGIQQERQALRQLAVALADGRKARGVFGDAANDDEQAKHPLDPAIPDMNCSVDDIANYIACYGSVLRAEEEAQNRYAELLSNLQAVLPRGHWKGAEIEPRIGSIRSFTCSNENSDAQIDIDLVLRWSPKEEFSYAVTLFGWTSMAPRL